MSRVVVVVCGFALVVGLVGCSGSPQPEPIDTGKATPSVSESTPSPPETPAPTETASPAPTAGSLDQQLHDATVAFYAAVQKSYATMDAAPIKGVIVPGSQAGGGYINDISASKAKGRKYSIPPRFSISGFEYKQGGEKTVTSAVVTFKLSTSNSREVDGKGHKVKDYPAGSANGRIILQREGKKWLVYSQQFEN